MRAAEAWPCMLPPLIRRAAVHTLDAAPQMAPLRAAQHHLLLPRHMLSRALIRHYAFRYALPPDATPLLRHF